MDEIMMECESVDRMKILMGVHSHRDMPGATFYDVKVDMEFK